MKPAHNKNRRSPGKRNGKRRQPYGTRAIEATLSPAKLELSRIPRAVPRDERIWWKSTLRGLMTKSTATSFNSQVRATGIGAALTTGLTTDFSTIDVAGQSLIRQSMNIYRVVSFRWKLTVVNIEAFPIISVCYPSNGIIANNVGTTTLAAHVLNEGGKEYILSGGSTANSGVFGSKRSFSGRVDCLEFFGSDFMLYDDNFTGGCVSGGTPTAPTNNIYLNYGGIALNTSNTFTNAGTQYLLELEQEVIVNEKNILAN